MNQPTLFEQFLQYDVSALFYLFGVAVALILLFILARLLRNLVGARVRQVEEFGMDFDSVASMLNKGLLTPEEAKKVKSVLARHFKQLYDKPKGGSPTGGAEADLATMLETTQAAPSRSESGPHGPGETIADQSPVGVAPAAREPATPPEEAPPCEPGPLPPSDEEPVPEDESADVPLDVLDMYRAGMITREEFAALRRFYAARGRDNA